MLTSVVVSSDRDEKGSMNMGLAIQQQALLWEQMMLGKVSENVIPASRPKGEQREAGEAREYLCGAGAEAP